MAGAIFFLYLIATQPAAFFAQEKVVSFFPIHPFELVGKAYEELLDILRETELTDSL